MKNDHDSRKVLLCLNVCFQLFEQRPLREPKGTKSCRKQGEYVCPIHLSICPSPPPEAPSRFIQASQMYGWMDRWMDGTYRFALYSAGLCPLWFPQWPLPCLHNSYHHEIPEQSKGTDDLCATSYFSVEGSPLSSWLSISCSATGFGIKIVGCTELQILDCFQDIPTCRVVKDGIVCWLARVVMQNWPRKCQKVNVSPTNQLTNWLTKTLEHWNIRLLPRTNKLWLLEITDCWKWWANLMVVKDWLYREMAYFSELLISFLRMLWSWLETVRINQKWDS